MSIKLIASLHIKTIDGRFGEFNVGTLLTELGEFTIKDKSIDQLSQGQYSGQFVISRIFPGHYSVGNRLVVETKAVIDSFTLDQKVEEDEAFVDRHPSLEVDPIEDEQSTVEEASKPAETKSCVSKDAGDQALFGILWPLGQQVKLDATVDRGLLRNQKKRLETLGYTLDIVTQEWVLNSLNRGN